MLPFSPNLGEPFGEFRLKSLPLLIFLVFAVSPQPAFAYLDPGTGSILLQVVLGGTAGLGLIAKLYWGRIRRLFNLHKSDGKKKQPTTAE